MRAKRQKSGGAGNQSGIPTICHPPHPRQVQHLPLTLKTGAGQANSTQVNPSQSKSIRVKGALKKNTQTLAADLIHHPFACFYDLLRQPKSSSNRGRPYLFLLFSALIGLPQRLFLRLLRIFKPMQSKCLSINSLHTKPSLSDQGQSRLIRANQGIFYERRIQKRPTSTSPPVSARLFLPVGALHSSCIFHSSFCLPGGYASGARTWTSCF